MLLLSLEYDHVWYYYRNWNARLIRHFKPYLLEGTEIWKSDPARPIELLDDVHVKLDIPASGLANGHYILTLSAMNLNCDFEEIQAYSFLVRIQVPSK